LSCKKCKTEYDIDQPYPYHAGFSHLGFLYCNKCANVVEWSEYDKTYQKVAAGKEKTIYKGHFPRVRITYKDTPVPWALPEQNQKAVENALKPCPCGGHFKFKNKLLCPKCRYPLSESILKTIYFYKLGNVIDGKKSNIWKK